MQRRYKKKISKNFDLNGYSRPNRCIQKVSLTFYKYELIDKDVQIELNKVQYKFLEWKTKVKTSEPDIVREFSIFQSNKSYGS